MRKILLVFQFPVLEGVGLYIWTVTTLKVIVSQPWWLSLRLTKLEELVFYFLQFSFEEFM